MGISCVRRDLVGCPSNLTAVHPERFFTDEQDVDTVRLFYAEYGHVEIIEPKRMGVFGEKAIELFWREVITVD